MSDQPWSGVPATTDPLVIAEYLRPDRLTIEEVRAETPSWYTFVEEARDVALARLGRKNNNWLKIIPLIIHEMARDITRACDDQPVRVDGQDYQDVFEFEMELMREFEQQQEPEAWEKTDDFDMSHDNVTARLKQLGEAGEREYLDPFWIESMEDWKQSQQTTDTDTDEPDEPEERWDPDLIM